MAGRDSIAEGQRVRLHSLQAKPELNGMEGTVVSFDTSSGRLGVQLSGHEKPIALRPANLTVFTVEEAEKPARQQEAARQHGAARQNREAAAAFFVKAQEAIEADDVQLVRPP